MSKRKAKTAARHPRHIGNNYRGRDYARDREAVRRLSAVEPPRKISGSVPVASSVRGDPSYDFWSTHPGTGLTPRGIVDTFTSAESGYTTTQCDLFDDVVESDGHLRACLEQRIDDVAGKDWILQPGGPDAADTKAAAILEEALRAVPNFSDAVEHQLSSLRYGYAAAEIDWSLVGGWWVPTWFRLPPARRFGFDSATGAMRILTSVTSSMYRGGWAGDPLAPGKWWTTTLRGRLAATASPLRTCTWWALFKRLAVRDLIVKGERFGLPYVAGVYAEGALPEEITVLKEAVQSLGTDGGAVYSEACKLVITESRAGADPESIQTAVISLAEAQVSKLMLGGTLTMGEGSSSGSYALGQVHQARSFALTVADSARLGRSFARDVGSAFCVYNGLAARPPVLYCHVMPEMDPISRANLAKICVVDLGMAISVRQLRREFQFQPPAGDDDALEKSEPPPAEDEPAPEPPAK
jgi:phage gp29-like protein